MTWLALLAVLAAGCSHQSEERVPYDFGAEGQLTFWLADPACGLHSTCSPTQVGLNPGLPPHHVYVGQVPERLQEPLPVLTFESSDPSVFVVADMVCNPSSGGEPCDGTTDISVYRVSVEVGAEGSAELIARLADGSVFDRGAVVVLRDFRDAG